MTDIRKIANRDRKINKRKNGMKIDNRNIFIIRDVQREKSEKIKREREEKEERINSD